MALTVGELVGLFELDASGAERGMSRAELAMRGLQRDVDGRLRDMRGRFVSESGAMGRFLGDGIGRGSREASEGLSLVRTALLALGPGAPYIAAATTALGGLAAGAVAAGAAVGAFQAAAKPQLEEVTQYTELAEKAEEAHEKATLKKAQAQKLAAKGGDEYKRALREAETAARTAGNADAELEQHLKGLPKPTQEAAKALQGLKDDHEKWAESLAGTTMPVFTQGINILRGLLPSLTPLVQAAAGAFGDFLGEVQAGVTSGGFQAFTAQLAQAAGPALENFLQVLKNLGVGFAGLLQAFLPFSAGMTGGLVEMTAAFAEWGQSLRGSAGFAEFIELARSGAGALASLGAAALRLVVAVAPLLGTTAMLANQLAKLISATPTPVLTALAAVIATVTVSMRVYSAAMAVATARTTLFGRTISTQGVAQAFGRWIAAAARWTAQMAATVARTVAGWATMAARSAASATRVAAVWVAQAARATAATVASVARQVAAWVVLGAQSLAQAARVAAAWVISMGPIGLVIAAVVGLVALIIANWDKIRAVTVRVWTAVWSGIKKVGQLILQFFMNWTLPGLMIKHWGRIQSGAKAGWNAVVNFVKTIPGKLVQFFLNWTLPGLMVKHWGRIQASAKAGWNAVVNFVRGVPGQIVSALASLGGRLWSLGSSAFERFRSAAVSKAQSTVAWMRGLPGMISSAIGNLGRLLYTQGTQVVQGLWSGISAMGGWIRSRVASFVSSAIPGPIRKALGIASPSKVAAQLGRYVGQGLVQGLTGTTSQVASASKKVADLIRKAFAESTADAIKADRKALDRLARQRRDVMDRIARAERTLRDRGASRSQRASARDTLRREQRRLSEIDRERGSLRRNIAFQQRIRTAGAPLLKRIARDNARLASLAKQRDGVAARLKSAQERLADVQKQWTDLRRSIAEGIVSAASITREMSVPASAGSILDRLRADVQVAQKFAGDLARLRRAGLDADLIAQVAQAGVQGGAATAAALASATSDEIAAINKQQSALEKAAAAAGTTTADAMYRSGIRAAQGLVDGLASEQKAIEAQMLTIAKGMQKAIRKALGIRSPSRVMAGIGRYIPAGLLRGIQSGAGTVDRAMRQLVTVPPVPAMAAAGGVPPAPVGAGQWGAGGGPLVSIGEFHAGGRSERQIAEELAWLAKGRG